MRSTVLPLGWGRPALLLTAVLWLMSCDSAENPLAPYEGERPLIIQRITQSFSPDLQWVGGRAAAVGVNRGERAALDSTLVWMRQAPGNEITSPVSINDEFNADVVTAHGGVPADSLEAGATYTVWVAAQEAFEGGVLADLVDAFSFVDTTFEASYLLIGRSGGGVGVDFTIVRDQSLLDDSYIVSWTPGETGFRQVAIREASSGGFTDLRWHIVLPDSVETDVFPPLIIGQVPPAAIVGTAWGGWGSSTHTLWATTRAWDGESFGFRSQGYAFFQAFSSNFE